MAFGDFVTSMKNSVLSITNPFAVTGKYVQGGDLVVVGLGQNTALTGTACTDTTSGNVFTLAPATGLDAGSATLITAYSLIIHPGIVTPSWTTTASTNDACIVAGVFRGPFNPAPLDANPLILSDASTPFTSNLTGTLGQTAELIVSFFVQALAGTATATSPNILGDQQLSAAAGATGSVALAVGSWVVAATTSVSASWTSSTTPTGGAVGILSFKQAAASDTLFGMASL